MKKKLTGILAVMLALVMVVSAGIYAKDAQLKASDENVYDEGTGEAAPASEVQEIIVEAEAAETPAVEEEAEEPAEEPAEDGEPAEEAEETEEEAEEPAEETEEPAEEAEETEESEEEAEEAEESEEDEEEQPELRVWITTSLDGVETVESGTVIVLTAHLEGFEGIEYTVQWQKSLDGIQWEDQAGATELVYKFALTEANDDYIWRVMIFTED